MNTGRPKESVREKHRWFARTCAKVMCEAIRRSQELTETVENDGLDLEAKQRRASNAWQYLSVLLCNYCDPAKPSKFLRQVADELDGKALAYLQSDEKIFNACLRVILKTAGRPLTLEKVITELGENPLSSKFALARKIEQLGIHLDKV